MQTPSHSASLSSDSILFISDLHLCASRPIITAAFLDFLLNKAIKIKALYILGDLFEYWAGDDDTADVFHHDIITAFKKATDSGLKIFFMHGNRDFLIAEDFCTLTGITLLQDPILIDLYGKKALLSHGDHLCVDDIAYQQFRAQVRDKAWQKTFLSQPLPMRKKQIEAIRMRSEQEKTHKPQEIMDVNAEAVKALLREYQPNLLIHGHTHRPNRHVIHLDGNTITRWVLGDWYDQGSYLACDKHGCRNVQL